MKINTKIIEEGARYATECLTGKLDPAFAFHNLSHTISVVRSTDIICREMQIDKQDRRVLILAAWFHDLGYTRKTDGHESEGAAMAEAFLAEQNVDAAEIERVKQCILATHYPQRPATELEKILCDADLMHLAGKQCVETSDVLRKEWELTRHKTYNDTEWYELNLAFLNSHVYHTVYGKTVLEKGKRKNAKKLARLLAGTTVVNDNRSSDESGNILPKKKKEKMPPAGKGVETFLRIASGNHMRLSGMADNKAHILLSINSLIISVIMSLLARKLTEAPYLIAPTIILLLVSLATIIFAVLTTRPKITKGVFTPEQISNREVNLLFFGNFHRMEPESYAWGIREMMHDKDYLYSSMTKDIYFLGKVLAVKYRYLNIGYKVFMYGIIAAVVAYIISFSVAFSSPGF